MRPAECDFKTSCTRILIRQVGIVPDVTRHLSRRFFWSSAILASPRRPDSAACAAIRTSAADVFPGLPRAHQPEPE